jgi:hypothetical protein
MALKKITQANENKGWWACTDCGWESEETDFLQYPNPPSHLCAKGQKREPTFDSDEE